MAVPACSGTPPRANSCLHGASCVQRCGALRFGFSHCCVFPSCSCCFGFPRGVACLTLPPLVGIAAFLPLVHTTMCACACVCACVHSCFVYCVRSGACVVVEDVETRQQQHLLGHKTEITAVLLSRDGALIASASGRHKVCVCVFVRAFVALLCLLYLSQPNASLVRLLIIASITHTHTKSHERSEVRVWDAQTGACKHRLVYHLSAVAALAFSLDNRQLLSLGHYQDPSLVWRHDERKRAVGRVCFNAAKMGPSKKLPKVSKNQLRTNVGTARARRRRT